jgi:transcription elongation GreA/GreB family factor
MARSSAGPATARTIAGVYYEKRRNLIMSRAFVKEADGDAVAEDLPERPVSKHPNYVTPTGLSFLREQVKDLLAQRGKLAESDSLADKQRLKSVERDLRYFEERASTALLVEPAAGADGHVHFGSTVEVLDGEGNALRFAIVGEDEADVAAGKISWVSPLARALLDAEVDDKVLWRRPAGDKELTVVSIRPGPA